MYQQKSIYAIALGLLGFFASFYSISFTHGNFSIYLQWGFVLPLIAAMAYGPKYGFVSGFFGLGAWFPFFIFKNNGFSNVITSLMFLFWFIYQGYFYQKNIKNKSIWTSPFLVVFPFLLVNFLAYYYLFPIAFSFNPPFWAVEAESFMPQNIIKSIAFKDGILKLGGLCAAFLALKIPLIRKTLRLEPVENQEMNLKIISASFLSTFALWIIWIFFNRIFITQTFPQNLLVIESMYEWIALIVCFFSALIISVVSICIYEMQLRVKNELNIVGNQIKSISNQLEHGMIYQITTYRSGEKQFTFVSDSVKKMYGFSPEKVYKNPNLLYDCIHKEDLKGFIEAENKAIENLEPFVYEARIIDKWGRHRWSHFSATPDQGLDGRIVWNAIETVITEQKEKHLQVEKLSQTDPLTGLYNRRYFDSIWQTVNLKEKLPIGIVMADVNGLKLVNDAFGHTVGDELLISVSNAIKIATLDENVAIRFGGDEFLIILFNADLDRVQEWIVGIKEEIKKIKFDDFETSVSFGYGIKNSILEHFNDVIRIADDMMYSQKLIESENMRLKTIDKIMTKLFILSEYEKAHSENVMALSIEIGQAMNLSEDQLSVLKDASRLHDIGKVALDERPSNKIEHLSGDQEIEAQRHCEIGYHLLKGVQAYQQASEIVLSHHECFNGTGYPRGLKKDEIPILSRIVAVANSYENGMDQDEISKYSGDKFDPEVVNALFRVL